MANITNNGALTRIIIAIGNLYIESDTAESDDKKRIEAAIQALREERRALANAGKTVTYQSITDEFKNSKDDLEEIIEVRKELANALGKANELIGSLHKVLDLLL